MTRGTRATLLHGLNKESGDVIFNRCTAVSQLSFVE